jgi:hypothetical protein
MLAGFMTTIQQSNAQLQAKISTDIKTEINSIKSDLKAENEKLILRFEKQSQNDRKEFAAKLESESRRLASLVEKVQRETESELVAVKKQIQVIGTEFESKIGQSETNTQILINELTDKMSDYRSEIDANFSKLGQEVNSQLISQKDNIGEIHSAATQEKSAVDRKLEQVDAKLELLANKINQMPNGQPLADSSVIGHGTTSPSVVQVNDPSSDGHSGTVENVMDGMNERISATSFLSNGELSLPTFDESSDVNPVYHLRRLDEFIQFRGVPKALQLAIACRSMIGQSSKQWVEAISQNLTDYESFKEAFLKAFWSLGRQSSQRCRLYQAKYNRQSGLSLSGHFLKYAMLASYLEPKPFTLSSINKNSCNSLLPNFGGFTLFTITLSLNTCFLPKSMTFLVSWPFKQLQDYLHFSPPHNYNILQGCYKFLFIILLLSLQPVFQ